MFENEVLISKEDKDEITKDIEHIKKILDKYPYSSCFSNSVSTMARAKCYVDQASEWIRYLHVNK